jgi:hypothetical protein
VLLFDLDDLLDDAPPLSEQLHQLLVNGVDLIAQMIEAGFGRGRGAGAGGVGWTGHREEGSERLVENQGAPRGQAGAKPKTETRKPNEIRNPKSECGAGSGSQGRIEPGLFRASDFGLPAVFGIRASDFDCRQAGQFFVAQISRGAKLGLC